MCVCVCVCCQFKVEREREMFYLTTHSTHFIYGHMVKDHSDSEKENPLPPQDNTYHGLCYTSRGALAGTRNSSMKDRSDDPSHHERTLYL